MEAHVLFCTAIEGKIRERQWLLKAHSLHSTPIRDALVIQPYFPVIIMSARMGSHLESKLSITVDSPMEQYGS